MKTITLLLGILFLVSCFPKKIKADSPITSTFFFSAYKKNKIVEYANKTGILDKEIVTFLLNSKESLEEKAAVINALSWDVNGKKNTDIFIGFLAEKYETDVDELFLEMLNADELMCLGYLMVMDNYFDPSSGLPVLELAKQKNPTSFTINMVLALVQSQVYLDSFQWCKIWQICSGVRTNKSLKKDMKEEAIELIFEYINIYEQSCTE